MAHGVLLALSKWLGATALSHAIQTGKWIIPTLQTVHILGVAVVFSAVILVDLRALRILQRDVPLAEVARRFLPALWPVLGLLLATGSLLIIGEPRRSLLNTTFYLKLALIALALLLTAALQRALATGFLEQGAWQRRAGQLVAGCSVLAWCSVLVAGRWIAYTEVGG
jgi:hypothetical protein